MTFEDSIDAVDRAWTGHLAELRAALLENARLRASHAELIAAAKRAILVMKDTRILGVRGRIDIAIEDLQAAISRAEEPTP